MSLRIYEIFGGLEGEGIEIGTPKIFIRTCGCTVGCAFCFGVKRGKKNPRIILSHEKSKKLTEVKVGDKLLTFDTKFNLVETEVKETSKRKVDEWYEVKINDVLYFVTPEHPFFTAKGQVLAKDLKEGDVLYHSSFKEKISFARKGNYNPMKSFVVVEKAKATTVQRRKDGIIVPHTMSEDGKRRTSERMKKSNPMKNPETALKSFLAHSRKKEMNGYETRLYNLLQQKGIDNIQYIGDGKKIVSHKVPDFWVNETNKLIEVYSSTYGYGPKHKQRGEEWKDTRSAIFNRAGYEVLFLDMDERSDEKILDRVQSFLHNGYAVEKIKHVSRSDPKYKYPYQKPAKLEVFNLTCAPYPSYLVDYFWVHNCDTPKALSPDSGKNMDTEEIIAELKKYPYLKNVTLTGGSPLEQDKTQLIELLTKLKALLYHITVEESGQAFDNDVFKLCDFLSIDAKPPSSGVVFSKHVHCLLSNNFSDKIQIKIVVKDEKDLEFVKEYSNWFTPKHLIITPCWEVTENYTALQERTKWICTEVLKQGIDARVILQQHKVIWGPSRDGV